MPLPILDSVRTSNMATYRRCKRRAFLQAVCKERGASSSSQTFGTVAHKIIELWLTEAALPPTSSNDAIGFINRVMKDADFAEKVGDALPLDVVLEAAKVVTKGLHLLPAPGPGLVVEEPFETRVQLPSVQDSGAIVECYVTFRSHGIDLYDTRPNAKIRLYDHKTCKSLSYVPTPEQMREDVQAISYAYSLCRRGGWKEIHCRWIYYPRSNEPAQAVDFFFTWSELQEKWARIEAEVRGLAALAEEHGVHGWAQVPGNLSHCEDYGGCEFLDKCNAAQFVGSHASAFMVAGGGESLFKQRKDQEMGLLDRARAGEKVGAAVSAPMPQAAVQPQASNQSLFAQKVKANGIQPPVPASLPPPQTTQQLHDTLAMSLKAAGISPPEPADVSAAEVQEGLEDGGEVEAAEPIPTLPVALAVGINPPDAAPADPTPPEAPKKKGRAKKEKTSEPVVIVSPVTQEEAQQVLDQLQAAKEQPKTLEYRPDVLAELLAKIRKYAEYFDVNEAAEARAIFILANKLERGEL